MSFDPNMIIFYVNDPIASASFYTEILGSEPIDAEPTFALFLLKHGMRLGLWAKNEVQPAVTSTGGFNELCFQVSNHQEVDALYVKWLNQGLSILQTPTMMDFGYTFTAVDPDQHRLRVFALSESKKK